MDHAYSAIVVDPDSTSRKTLASLIRKHFKMSDIYTASSAREAAGTLRQIANIDWIFCESTLTDKDTFEFLSECKEIKSSTDAKIILLSTSSGKDALIKAAAHGVSDLILKPFSPKTILEKVKKLLNGKNLRKSNRIPLLEAFEAHVEFQSSKYKTALIDISLGGCMAKAPVFSKGGMIYDKTLIHIPLQKQSLKLNAELVRLERDNSSDSAIILAAFIFKDLSPKTTKALSDFLGAIRSGKRPK